MPGGRLNALVAGGAVAALLAALPAAAPAAGPPVVQAPRIYVVDQSAGLGKRGILFSLDTAGRRTIVTQFGAPGAGPGSKPQPLGKDPVGVAVEADGTVLVIDRSAGTGGRGALFTVDASTGRRAMLSDFGKKAEGPLGSAPTGVALAPGGRIYVIDEDAGSNCPLQHDRKLGCGALFSVDGATGVRTIVSDFGDASLGPQPALNVNDPYTLAVAPSGMVYVGDRDGDLHNLGLHGDAPLLAVDPTTGERSLVVNFDPSPQLTTAGPDGLAVDDAAHLYVVVASPLPQAHPGLYRVETATGAITPVSDLAFASGVRFVAVPVGVAVFHGDGGFSLPDGSVLIGFGNGTPVAKPVIFRIDPGTGSRAVFSDLSDPAQGPTGVDPSGIAVGPAPAPPPPPPPANKPPTASFTFTTSGLQASFDASASSDPDGEITSYLWDFGDGTTGSGVTASHTYAAGGSYTVTLKVVDDGFAAGTVSHAVAVSAPAVSGSLLTFGSLGGTPVTVYGVDRLTGQRHALTNLGDSTEGPTLAPWRIAAGGVDTVLVTGRDLANVNDGKLVSIDAATGQRVLVTDFGDPTQGPVGYTPFGVAYASANTYLVTDRGQGGGGNGAALWRIIAGVRTKLSDFNNPAQGPLGSSPEGVAVDSGGAIYVADAEGGSDCTGFGDHCGALFRVDGATGMRTLVSDFGNAAQGPVGSDPVGLAFAGDGSILVIDGFAGTCGCGELFRVNPSTGARTLVTDFGNASEGAPVGARPTSVAVEADGTIVTDGCLGPSGGSALCKVDATGLRTALSDSANGALGPTAVQFGGGLAVYP